VYKINFYVPEAHLETVKEAMFLAGAGRVGNYDRCAWQIKGQGQFRPLEGSEAFLGEVNRLEKVVEYKVELVCCHDCLKAAILALKAAHPYETPAYDVVKCLEF